MEYTKQQLIGLRCTQHYLEYIILEDGDSLKFQKNGQDYKGWSVERINGMIKDNNITLLSTPNTEPQYEIY